MTYRSLVRAINQTVPTPAVRRKLISNARALLRGCNDDANLDLEAARAISILRRVARVPGGVGAFYESSRWSSPKKEQ